MKTPFQLNIEAQLTIKRGLTINPEAQLHYGIWNSGGVYSKPETLSYSQGTLTSSNVTGIITSAFPNFYEVTNEVNNTNILDISVPVWRNLLRIGRPNDSRSQNSRINCSALGNSKPDEFITTYAGYGTFSGITDKFYNKISSTGLSESIYPPYDYPADPSNSYVFQNWSSVTPNDGAPDNIEQTSFVSFQEKYQYYQEYSWVTGWPGVYVDQVDFEIETTGWQDKTGIDWPNQKAYYPEEDGDSYAAAYFPRPDLRSRDKNKIEYDEYFSNGYVATLARQAYYEFWKDYSDRRSNQYIEFTKAWDQCFIFQEQSNDKIASFNNTLTFLKGAFSNNEDLNSSDISGVNLAFKSWGDDMIALGNSLDLSTIHKFGTPSKFLLNLQKNNALTQAMKLALLYSGLNTTDLNKILVSTYVPTLTQESLIYKSFEIITGKDLDDIKLILNCTTKGLSSLADLLNPMKMFPNSYQSLTIPNYDTSTPTAKVYDFIYIGGNVNDRIKDWGNYLSGILPFDLAKACGAFMMTMNQIKNIRQMTVGMISQVISNLENTTKDLPLTIGTDGVPGNVAAAKRELDRIALGSGEGGTYRFSDFFGAMAGQPYNDYFKKIMSLIKSVQTQDLENIYVKLLQKSLHNYWAHISRGKGWQDTYINPTPVDAGITESFPMANKIWKVTNQSSTVVNDVGTVTNIIECNYPDFTDTTLNILGPLPGYGQRSVQTEILPTGGENNDVVSSNTFLGINGNPSDINFISGQIVSFIGGNTFNGSLQASEETFIVSEILSPTSFKIESTLNLPLITTVPSPWTSGGKVNNITVGSSINPNDSRDNWPNLPTSGTRWYSQNFGNSPPAAGPQIPNGWRYDTSTYNGNTGGFNPVTSSGFYSDSRPDPDDPSITQYLYVFYIDVEFGSNQSGGQYMSEIPYEGWPGLPSGSNNTSSSVVVFEREYNGYPGDGILDGTVQNLIDAANLEILRIQNNNKDNIEQLNKEWNNVGKQHSIEQRAIVMAIPQCDSIYTTTSLADLENWILNLETYAKNTFYCESSPILNAICDLTDVGGQSIQAAQREARNDIRLMNTGGELDNKVPSKFSSRRSSAIAVVNDECVIQRIEVTRRGKGYRRDRPPIVLAYPQSGSFGTTTNPITLTNRNVNGSSLWSRNIQAKNISKGWVVNGPGVVNGKVTSTTVLTDVVNGGIISITITGGTFIENEDYVISLPTPSRGVGCKLKAVVDDDGSISRIDIVEPGVGYCAPPQIYIEPPPTPEKLGIPEKGTLTQAPWTETEAPPITPPIATNQTTPGTESSYSVEQAIQQIIQCNCDCWEE